MNLENESEEWKRKMEKSMKNSNLDYEEDFELFELFLQFVKCEK